MQHARRQLQQLDLRSTDLPCSIKIKKVTQKAAACAVAELPSAGAGHETPPLKRSQSSSAVDQSGAGAPSELGKAVLDVWDVQDGVDTVDVEPRLCEHQDSDEGRREFLPKQALTEERGRGEGRDCAGMDARQLWIISCIGVSYVPCEIISSHRIQKSGHQRQVNSPDSTGQSCCLTGNVPMIFCASIPSSLPSRMFCASRKHSRIRQLQ